MHETVENLIQIQKEIKEKIAELKFNNYEPTIIAVSKTFSLEHIKHLIDHGHKHFGENKVQEAMDKWSDIKEKFGIKLHMVGKLQTNKVKQAVRIFDFIHSIDSEKLAQKVANEQKKINKNIKIFIQINIGDEVQKSGVEKQQSSNLIKFCLDNSLDIQGLMCLPPFGEDSTKYFLELSKMNNDFNLTKTSMGMSDDYIKAINYKSSYLRIGSKIFGKRN